MKRAIIIGINYTGEPYALPDCEQDADTMAAMLKKQGVETTVVKGDCSPSWFMSHLMHVATTEQEPKDTLYIYFSGHGTQFPDPTEENGIGEALCFYDKRHGQIVLLKDDDLVAALDRIPGTKIIIFDSCFSGGMDRDSVAPIEGIKRKSLQYDPDSMPFHGADITRDVLRLTPQYYLFACSEEQVSYSTGNGGVFTIALKQCDRFGYRTLSKIVKATKAACYSYGQAPTAHVVGGSYSKKVI